jgi:glycine hydroxymethyltransferase
MITVLNKVDPAIYKLIKLEENRQQETLMMIPSENYAPRAVREAVGSVLTNKYSEGYARKRYYQGNKFVDKIEMLAIERARELFGVPFANVQPYSGSPANSAIYFGLLNPGDKIMGLKLSGGGHLTHGHPDITFSGKFYTSVQYDVEEDGTINLDKAAKLAKKEKPKIIVVGTTAYPRIFNWKKWKEIADSVGALFLADISHIVGLIVGEVHPSPIPFADIVMFTTHKTLRGPRGAIVLVTEKGLLKDKDMGEKIKMAVFPGLQGGPHNNITAGIAVALKLAGKASFKKYARKIVDNAQVLAGKLIDKGFTITTGGTDNHLMVIDLRKNGVVGNIYAEALEKAGIVANRNSIPHDPNPPFYPSGVRLGTPGVTSRGMGTKEMRRIAGWFFKVLKEVSIYQWPKEKTARIAQIREFRENLPKNKKLAKIAEEVKVLCRKFPLDFS